MVGACDETELALRLYWTGRTLVATAGPIGPEIEALRARGLRLAAAPWSTGARPSPASRCAVGKIVEVVSMPYEAPDWTYLPGVYYDVRFESRVFYCRSDKLRPISDPDADVTQTHDETVTA